MGGGVLPRWRFFCFAVAAGATAVLTAGACGAPATASRAPTQSQPQQGPEASPCVLSLQNPAELLVGTWDAIYSDPDGTAENPPYTGPRTFSLRIWKSSNGLTGTMSYPAVDAYVPVTLPTTAINIVGEHVTITAPSEEQTITVQGDLQCPGPVFNANKTVTTDPDVTPLRFEKQPGS